MRPPYRPASLLALAQRLEPRLHFATYYVDASQSPGFHTGLSWNDAFQTLGDALLACGAGDAIRVGPGTYMPAGSGRDATFNLKDGMSLSGGYQGRQSDTPDQPGNPLAPTILSGDIGTLGDPSDNAFHVVTATSLPNRVVLASLAIQDGNSSGAPALNDDGAGLLLSNSVIDVSSCTFRNNTASSDGVGGGAFVSAGSNAFFNLCTFQSNTAKLGGGTASRSSQSRFLASTFLDNSATANGGGLYLETNDPVRTVAVDGSEFHHNTAAFGGAIFATANSNLQAINALFSYNQATSNSGAIDISFGSTTTLFFCTFTHNTAGSAGGAVTVFQSTLADTNSIFWLDTAGGQSEEIFVFPNTTPVSTATLTSSLVQGGFTGGTNILNADPQFVRGDSSNGRPDLHLRIGSPAIDAGTASGTGFIAGDRTNRPRTVGAAPDLGAFEGGVDITPPTSTFFTPAASNTTTFPRPLFTNSTSIPLTWSGSDNVGGLLTYKISVSDNDGPFVDFLASTNLTSTTFNGAPGHLYAFGLFATDAAGNQEIKQFPDLYVAIDQTAPTSSVTALPAFTTGTANGSGSVAFPITFSGTDNVSGSGIASYSLFVSDNGGPYALFAANVPPFLGNGTGAFLPSGFEGHTIRLYTLATDNAGNTEPVKLVPDVTTILDATAPTSAVAALPTVTTTTTIPLSFPGTDAISGVASYSLFVSDNAGPFTLVTTQAASTFQFTGLEGHTYGFYSVATDNAGNAEVKTAAEATTVIDTLPPTSAVAALPAQTTTPSITLNFPGTDAASGIASYSLFVSDNSGPLTLATTGASSTFEFTGLVDGHTYGFLSRATDNGGNTEVKTVADATTTAFFDTPLLTERGDGLPTSPNLVAAKPKLKLPKAVAGAIVGGSVLKGSLSVSNVGTGPATGPLTVTLYLSSDATVSAKDRLLVTLTGKKPLKLKKGAATSLPFSVTLPADFAGTGNLLAIVNPSATGVALPAPESTTLDNSVTIATFPVAIPALNLTAGALTAKPPRIGRPGKAVLTVANTSNMPFNGAIPITATLLDSNGSSVTTRTFTRSARLAIGGSIKITLPFDAPATAGAYTLRARFALDPSLPQTSTDDDAASVPLTVVG